jgi:hypothetical protein
MSVEGARLSELTENCWAVLSERGCEAMGLTYTEARDLMRALVRERVHGLSVITDDAARRAGGRQKVKGKRLDPEGVAHDSS